MKAVTAQHIKKSYNGVQALKGVSLEVEEGEIFGIIGPDGAGKTTLFRILTTLLLPDSGSAMVKGFDVIKAYKLIRRKVGYMPGRFSLYHDLTVVENLRIFASLFNTSIEENYDLIKDIYQHIEPFKKRRAGALSGGMKQKLALSCALIHRPEVLFLDEPTTGVDPLSRKELWEMLKKLKKQGIAILVSTPYMDEASLCDRIALIQHGIFLKTETPQKIIAQFENILWSVHSKQMFQLLKDLRSNPHVLSCYAFGDTHHITVEKKKAAPHEAAITIAELEAFLKEKGHLDIKIDPIQAGIEDSFLELANK
ncbi:ABC transporter ATP-binding protein [Xanthovirga aplysinae]|uniref:ABC transporter ATP-binding protein n=1 Tax=Xanthovirga aplysinae TaxID=2529853 RepID=UPI0012BD1F44|nr:ABC transporter ATP-binding protein [Xanthovirga aplysinae]MTI31619.1 ABC transporter ATP-binding protein [Xanthovirga aplysinae]